MDVVDRATPDGPMMFWFAVKWLAEQAGFPGGQGGAATGKCTPKDRVMRGW